METGVEVDVCVCSEAINIDIVFYQNLGIYQPFMKWCFSFFFLIPELFAMHTGFIWYLKIYYNHVYHSTIQSVFENFHLCLKISFTIYEVVFSFLFLNPKSFPMHTGCIWYLQIYYKHVYGSPIQSLF